MPVAVIADCHIGGPGGGPEPLVRQLDELAPPRCARLVLLGDVFQVWVGAPQYETPAVRDVLEAVGRLRARGVRVDYLEGNRDFFIAGGPYAAAFDGVWDELDFVTGGRRYLAIHGDGLDPSDRQYRFWRRLSKSAVSRAAASALPAALTHRFIHGTERRLADTNFQHKVRVPEEVILGFAARRLAEGHDEVLFGHYHDPREWSLPGGEVRILEAWFHARKVHWLGVG